MANYLIIRQKDQAQAHVTASNHTEAVQKLYGNAYDVHTPESATILKQIYKWVDWAKVPVSNRNLFSKIEYVVVQGQRTQHQYIIAPKGLVSLCNRLHRKMESEWRANLADWDIDKIIETTDLQQSYTDIESEIDDYILGDDFFTYVLENLSDFDVNTYELDSSTVSDLLETALCNSNTEQEFYTNIASIETTALEDLEECRIAKEEEESLRQDSYRW